MTFPGNIKGCVNTLSLSLSLSLSSSFILAAEQTNFKEESVFSFWTIIFSGKSFLYHLFIPFRPTGPQSFKWDALFLL